MERVGRVAGPAAVALFSALGIVMGPRTLAVALTAAGVAAVAAVVLSWRRAAGWPLAAGVLPVGACLVVLGHGEAATLSWMGLCVLAGWVALTSGPVVAAVAGVTLALVPVTEWFGQTAEPGWAAWCVGTAFTALSCAFAARLRTTVEELRSAQAQLAERTRTEERNRIAHEVHDVIGHALTVSLLHIGSARLALDEEPEEAHRSLAEAERLARRSLEEVRATVGLMRTDAPGETAPLPTAADIDELVASLRQAGVDIDLVVDGDVGALGSARGLAAYRIVQEALTNAVRHAPGQPVAVRVVVAKGRAAVTVTNPAGATRQVRPGSGLRGMQERAESVGGRVTAGPVDTGWRVAAELPW